MPTAEKAREMKHSSNIDEYQTDFYVFAFNLSYALFRFFVATVGAIIFPILAWIATFLQFICFLALWVIFGVSGAIFFFLRIIGFDELLDSISDHFADGTSLVQWAAPSLFELQAIPTALEKLHSATSTAFYDPDIAKGLVALSSLVYEDIKYIKQTAEKWQWNVSTVEYPTNLQQEESLHKETGARIFHKTEKGELVVVVCFRGTSPRDLTEWLVDCNIIKCDSRPLLFGQVHVGFFGRLFVRNPNNVFNEEKKTVHPYQQLVSLINKEVIADRKRGDKGGKPSPVRIWVTGHSLGAALATLFYARLMKCPEDIKGQIVGCYTFGSPRVGDYEFASKLREYMFNVEPSKEYRLWRVINALDIVPRVPLGWDSMHRSNQENYGIFDYSHVGTRVQLHYRPHGQLPFSNSKCVTWLRTRAYFIEDYLWHWNFTSLLKNLKQRQWVVALTWFLPSFIFDHVPAFYYQNMANIEQ